MQLSPVFLKVAHLKASDIVLRERLFRLDNETSEARKFVQRNYHNVVSYIHIPLVP